MYGIVIAMNNNHNHNNIHHHHIIIPIKQMLIAITITIQTMHIIINNHIWISKHLQKRAVPQMQMQTCNKVQLDQLLYLYNLDQIIEISIDLIN
jgi:hypothetical protein